MVAVAVRVDDAVGPAPLGLLYDEHAVPGGKRERGVGGIEKQQVLDGEFAAIYSPRDADSEHPVIEADSSVDDAQEHQLVGAQLRQCECQSLRPACPGFGDRDLGVQRLQYSQQRCVRRAGEIPIPNLPPEASVRTAPFAFGHPFQLALAQDAEQA